MPNVMTVYVRRFVIASSDVVRDPFRGDHKAIKLDSQDSVEVCWTSNLSIVYYTLSSNGIL